MREIKFRAWMNPDKVMLSHEDLMGIPVTYHDVFEGNSKYPCMQYTGLKDKNGVEIYEGDICRVIGGEVFCGVFEFNKILTVQWHGNGFDLVDDDKCGYGWGLSGLIDDITVIGNIYEHSHLLLEKTK